MNIKLILYGLFLSSLFHPTCSQDTLVFGITPNDPMVYCHIGDEFTGLDLISDTISEQVRGYDIDLLKFLAYRNSWDLTKLKVICLDYDTLLDKIKNHEIIMGLGGIPITALRLSEGYEFSLPVYSSGLRMVSRTWSENQIWSFFDSFETSLWVVILFTTLFTGIVTWILEDQNFQWRKNRQRMVTNLKEMIWQTFSGLFYTSEIRLQKFPARIVWLCFWFMILILTATYTADLSTKMSIKTPQLKYKNLQEAGTMGMNIATLEPYKKVVSSYGIQNLVVKPWSETSLSEIEDMFLDGLDGVVIDAPAAFKLNSKFPCSSSVLTDSINSFNYGYIFWKDANNTFIQSIDAALLEIKESREYQAILKQNIYVAPEDAACQDTFQKLTFSKLGGLWIIFAGAIVVAFIIDRVNAFFERKKGSKKALTSKRVDEMNADEKKFVLDSYLMISDYIHIPSSDLHLKLEDDIKNALENVEQTLKDRFNNIEKKILDILNSSKAHGILDASTSEIQSQIDQQQAPKFDFNFDKKLKLD